MAGGRVMATVALSERMYPCIKVLGRSQTLETPGRLLIFLACGNLTLLTPYFLLFQRHLSAHLKVGALVSYQVGPSLNPTL